MASGLVLLGLAMGAASIGALLYLIFRRGRRDEQSGVQVMEYNIDRDDEGRISRIEKLFHNPQMASQPARSRSRSDKVEGMVTHG